MGVGRMLEGADMVVMAQIISCPLSFLPFSLRIHAG